jgi:hypothetical protein
MAAKAMMAALQLYSGTSSRLHRGVARTHRHSTGYTARTSSLQFVTQFYRLHSCTAVRPYKRRVLDLELQYLASSTSTCRSYRPVVHHVVMY